MKKKIKGKKILVLGGVSLSPQIVKMAQDEGAIVFVTDYLKCSPAKLIANKSFMISTHDTASILRLIKKEKIEGVVTPPIDSLLANYQKICEKANLKCYGSKEQIDIFTNKNKFKNICCKFNIPIIKEYRINNLEKIKFPVLIKPTDNSGGKGVFICKTKKEFNFFYKQALLFSPSKRVIIEEFVEGQEVQAHYLIINKKIYFITMFDRCTNNLPSDNFMPILTAQISPSKHLINYKKLINNKVIKMIKSLKIENGVLFFQAITDGSKFYFFDPGFRLSGAMEYIIFEKLFNINTMKMLINYSVTGEMDDGSIEPFNGLNYKKWGCNISFSVKTGKIGKIIGINDILQITEVVDVVLSYREGENVLKESEGTLGQRILRVFIVTQEKEKLIKAINKIKKKFKVLSVDGKNMLLPSFDINEIYDRDI